MKVLIAFDNSEYARQAISDLAIAGLPDEVEALVVTVSDLWFPATDATQQANTLPFDRVNIARIREAAQRAMDEAERVAVIGSELVSKQHPAWRVEHQAIADSPAWAIIKKAEEWQPDLIVTGSHGRGGIGRLVLGSVSLKVLTEAQCSVRIARHSKARTNDDASPQRLIIGIDGSLGAQAAVDAVLNRQWRVGSAARLITVVEPVLYGVYIEQDIAREKDMQQYAAHQLGALGLHVSSIVKIGEPKRLILEEAEAWSADAIFIGAKGHRFMERVLLGSVSYAVAARAQCSVEIVRGTLQETI